MSHIERLKRSAQESLANRGHTVTPEDWQELSRSSHRIVMEYVCACGRGVVIDTYPPANGITVGGAAVALECGEPEGGW